MGSGKMGERKGHGQVGSILRLQVRTFGKKTERDVETEQRDRDKGTKKAAVRRQRIERQKTETRQRQ